MPAVPNTLLATSNPVDICRGFALFPAVGTVRAGVSTSAPFNRVIDIGRTEVVVFAFSLGVGFQVQIGMCGPAYGIAMTVDALYDESRASIGIQRDQTAAGFFFGFSVRVEITGGLEALEGIEWSGDRWASSPVARWSTALDIDLAFEIDLISLILSFIVGRLGEDSRTGTRIDTATTVLPITGQTFSLLDTARNEINSSQGRYTVSPRIDIPINIATLVARSSAPLKAALKALEKTGSEIAFGPQISIIFPIDFWIAGFEIDTAQYYTNPRWEDIGVVFARTGGRVPAVPRRITVAIRHTAGARIGLAVGLFFNFTFFKVFSAGATWQIELPNLLNLNTNPRLIENRISNNVGQRTVGFDPLRRDEQEVAAEEYEVVFA
jgi:hypothetical protein